MANPIDVIITPAAIQAVDKVISELKELDKKMQDSARLFIQASNQMTAALNNITPSNASATAQQNAQLTAQIQQQAQALAQLQAQYNRLQQSRQRSSRQTAEEAVNQGILNRNAREAATANSALAGAYGRLNAQHAIAARNLQNLIARGRLATQTQREYNRELDNAQREFNELNARITAADRAVQRFNRNVGNYPSQAVKGLKDLLAAFGLVGGLQLAANLAKDIYETTKEIQSMDMALKQVTQTQEIYAQSQMFLSRIAEAYGADLGKLTEQFTQFYVSAKDKLSGSQIEDIFESITKAGAAMGLSTEKQERAFLALNQMMSKGTIQAEELKGQLGEALPGALGIMAKALGVTEIELAKMMKDGQLLAADVLPKFAKQLEITYGIENVNRIETLAAAQTRYTNAWRDFVRGLDEDGNKLSNFMKKAIGVGTDLLIGVSRLAESDQQTRNRILKTLQESGYNQTLSYYKSLKELKDEDLENDRTYILKKSREDLEEYKRLERRNLILKAITPKELTYEVQTNDKLMQSYVKGRAEMAENLKKMKEINELQSRRQGQVNALNKLLDKGKPAQELEAKLTKEQLKAIEDALKAKYEMAKKEIELEILKQETILNGEYSTLAERNKALQIYNTKKLELINLDYNEHVRLAKGNADKIKSADLDMQMAIIKQTTDSANKRIAINKRYEQEYIQDLKDIEDFLKKYNEEEISRKEAADDLDVKIFNAKMARWEKEYDRLQELKKATKDYLGSFTGEFFSNAGFGETFETFFKQIDDGTGKMTTKFKQLLEGAGKDKWKVYFNSIAQSAQEAFNFINEMSAKNFDEENKRLQSQYDIALKFAGDNKEAQEKLADDLEKRKAEVANREAKAKKRQALFNIAIDTAQAVVESLPNYVLAAIIAGIGLAQAAAVNSQEIPQYWMGGTHDGGLMMVNDGKGPNYKETIVTPDGKIMKPQGRNVIMDAPAGTEIYTHEMWQNKLGEMLQGKGIDMAPTVSYNGLSKSDMYDVLSDTLGMQPQYHSNFDAEGATSYIMKNGNRTTNLSKRGNSTKLRFN